MSYDLYKGSAQYWEEWGSYNQLCSVFADALVDYKKTGEHLGVVRSTLLHIRAKRLLLGLRDVYDPKTMDGLLKQAVYERRFELLACLLDSCFEFYKQHDTCEEF